MALLFLGLIIGALLGVFIMGCLQISRESDKRFRGRD
jgi:LPS O-antigen subunit length determinant protein (WzzB/FepE family)